MGERIQLMVNGTQREAVVEGEPSLLTVLRGCHWGVLSQGWV